jgi:hypothetical protein
MGRVALIDVTSMRYAFLASIPVLNILPTISSITLRMAFSVASRMASAPTPHAPMASAVPDPKKEVFPIAVFICHRNTNI